jgi:tRNA (Thr-GGU) A37 N-methylase
LVELLKIEGRILAVKGLDYFDGTPVLDIKPYKESYRVDTFRVPNC